MKARTAVIALFVLGSIIGVFITGMAFDRDIMPMLNPERINIPWPAQDAGVLEIRILLKNIKPQFLVSWLTWKPFLTDFELVNDPETMAYFEEYNPDVIYSNLKAVSSRVGYLLLSIVGRENLYQKTQLEYLFQSKDGKWFSAKPLNY